MSLLNGKSLLHHIEHEIENPHFGKYDPRNFVFLSIKILYLLVPGIILGHVIDQSVDSFRRRNLLGSSLFTYILLQTIMTMGILYLLIVMSKDYTFEFQTTYAGLFFTALFFGMQSNYIRNLQQFLGKLP